MALHKIYKLSSDFDVYQTRQRVVKGAVGNEVMMVERRTNVKIGLSDAGVLYGRAISPFNTSWDRTLIRLVGADADQWLITTGFNGNEVVFVDAWSCL